MNLEFAPFLKSKRQASSQQLEFLIKDQEDFDKLFVLAFSNDRQLSARALSLVTRIVSKHNGYLTPHKTQLLALLQNNPGANLKSYLPALITKAPLTSAEILTVWNILAYWALNRNERLLTRIHALHGMFDIACNKSKSFGWQLLRILNTLSREYTPSLKTSIRKLVDKFGYSTVTT